MRTAFLRDPVFWLAMGAGPLGWLLLRELGHVRPATDWAGLVLVVVTHPLLEELAFRGWLQGRLLTNASGRTRRYGISRANFLTSLAFVIFHLISQMSLWALLLLFPSLIFGYLRERHQSVLSAVVLHMFYNAGLYGFLPSA